MTRFCIVATLLTGLLALGFINRNTGEAGAVASDKIKIGVYDTRAIAIAWAASTHNPVGEKMKEYEAAKQANNKAKIMELEAWGPDHQKKLHFQGFGRVPVGELFEPVNQQVDELLKAQNLAAITMACDSISDQVEIVDITMDLVKLFEPSDRTLESVKQVMKREPLTLVELSKLDSKD